MLRGTVYLEIPYEWEGDPPTQKELDRTFEDLIAKALAQYEHLPTPAITVESQLMCTECHAPVEAPELTPDKQESDPYPTRLFPSAENN